MTYFVFLIRFIVIPALILAVVAVVDGRRGKTVPSSLRNWPIWAATLLHIVLAVVYTTPWDNYLVATGVWVYDPRLVIGITLGWVPIEEYTFFVVQTILAGLWLLFLMRHVGLPRQMAPLRAAWRYAPLPIIGVVWLASVIILTAGWAPGTYLALILAWALPPIALQVGFGGDILRRYGRLTLLAIASLTLYLAAVDSIAIGGGTWTIAPATSLPILIGGVLPVEEFVFFLATNTLITFGSILVMSQEGGERLREIRQRLSIRKSTPQVNE